MDTWGKSKGNLPPDMLLHYSQHYPRPSLDIHFQHVSAPPLPISPSSSAVCCSTISLGISLPHNQTLHPPCPPVLPSPLISLLISPPSPLSSSHCLPYIFVSPSLFLSFFLFFHPRLISPWVTLSLWLKVTLPKRPWGISMETASGWGDAHRIWEIRGGRGQEKGKQE